MRRHRFLWRQDVDVATVLTYVVPSELRQTSWRATEDDREDCKMRKVAQPSGAGSSQRWKDNQRSSSSGGLASQEYVHRPIHP